MNYIRFLLIYHISKENNRQNEPMVIINSTYSLKGALEILKENPRSRLSIAIANYKFGHK